MTLTNDAKAVVALTTRLGTRQRPSLTAKKWHELNRALADAGHGAEDIFEPSFDVGRVPGVDEELAERIAKLSSDAAAAFLEVDELQHKGIWTSTIFDDGYPHSLVERLGHNAPPVIFGVGDVSLLPRPGVGIVGSRDVSESGGDVAQALARQVAALDMTVISGAARGVDELAMNACFDSGGSVVGVLADSLIGRVRKPDVLQALDAGKLCLISQQTPSSGFTPAAAMSRNKIVYALSDVTLVVASDEESGGTWAGAKEALNANNGVVAVWRGDGEGPGNAALEALGAQPLRNPSELPRLLGSQTSSEQLTLGITPS